MKKYFPESKIDNFFELNLDLICVADNQGKLIEVNKEFENTLGCKIEELYGKDFISLKDKEDVTTLEIINKLMEEKTKVTFISKYICKNKKNIYIEWNAVLEGKNIFASGRNITKRIEREEELKSINSELIKLTETLKQRNKELELAANTDKLTTIYNRNFFEEIIENEIKKADKKKETMSLIIFDLDNFKQINDTWGHPVGDKVLKVTALIAKDVIRKTDILFRWGGEEFIILMPKTKLKDAVSVAERIRNKMEKNTYEKVGYLTGSFGVAERSKNESFRTWYKKADKALYIAKSKGRNCVFSNYHEENKSLLNLNIQWKAEWESGNKQIDQQHSEILEAANKLMNIPFLKYESGQITQELELLLKHLEKHFDYEEKILNEIGYPSVVEHSKLHKKLIKEIVELKRCSDIGKLKDFDLFKVIINDIAIGHMIDEDTKFFKYLKNKAQ